MDIRNTFRAEESLHMDWFEKITGFRERSYDETRRLLRVEGNQLLSEVNGASYQMGSLELPSLAQLRLRAQRRATRKGKLRVSALSADVRALHRTVENNGALFQVASQFNLLEMTSP